MYFLPKHRNKNKLAAFDSVHPKGKHNTYDYNMNPSNPAYRGKNFMVCTCTSTIKKNKYVSDFNKTTAKLAQIPLAFLPFKVSIYSNCKPTYKGYSFQKYQ